VSYQMTMSGLIGFGQDPPPNGPPVPSDNGGTGIQLRELPPPCDDKEKLREMVGLAVGAPVPASDATKEEKGAFMMALFQWMSKEKIGDHSTPQQVCDALVRSQPSWWEQQSTETKVAIGAGGIAVVGLTAYFLLR